MLSDLRKFMSGEGLPKHPKKHHKPFRLHHATLFFAGVILFIVSAFGAGFILGKSSSEDIFVASLPQNTRSSSIKEVKSSLGFQFRYDSSLFSVEGQAANRSEAISGDSLSSAEKLTSVFARPHTNTVNSEDALSELSIETEESKTPFSNFKNGGFFTDNNEALESYYAPEDNELFSYERHSKSKSELGDKELVKIIYKQTPKFGRQSKPVYQVLWIGMNHNRPLKIEVQGLLSPDEIPGIYNQIFRSLKFGVVTGSALESLVFSIFEDEGDTSATEPLDVNAVSPAVVKIYHFICGRLVLQGRAYGEGLCGTSVGSGFLISKDGIIATNGHVISKDAADILVGEFLNNPALLAQFAASEGLPIEQITQRDAVASLLAKLYDMPQSELRLENKDEVLLAALGEKPVGITSVESIRNLEVTVDNDFVKEARIIGVDYEPKDLLTIEQGTELGFSASDVALLKIAVEQAPFIALADSSRLQQNAKISLIGFPSDAENNLISDTSIAPTVTNGTISSIRTAKGSDSKLFQTDADASQGSSGGPAITEDGQAFGILTYRFKDNNVANAAKSYIRDITDLKELIETNNLTINTDSETQKQWEEGLRLFNRSRYSAALDKFKIVYHNYPAHRLVNSYALQAQNAIKDGKDIKDTNYSLLGLIYGGIAGFVGIIIGAALLAHHHKHHQAYRKDYTDK